MEITIDFPSMMRETGVSVQRLNNLIALGISEGFYGQYYLQRHEVQKAIEKTQKSAKYFESASWPMMVGTMLGYLGYGYYLNGDLDIARTNIEKGYELMKKANVNIQISIFPLFLSYVYHDLKDFPKAHHFAQEAIELSVKYYARQFEALSRISLGRITAKLYNPKSLEAKTHIITGINILKELNLRPWLTESYFFLGELYANSGRKDEAMENLNKSLVMCQEMGIEYWLPKIQSVLDRL